MRYRHEGVVDLRTFEKSASVTAEAVYTTIIDSLGSEQLKSLRSVMADTTSMNTGKKKGINSRLVQHMNKQAIHILECQFHVNEILLNHVIKHIDGKLVAPDRMHPDSVYNKIKLLPQQASITETDLVRNIDVPMRSLRYLRSILEWFSTG